ncbi:hypothetical protein [uncultured Rossellomorea sp.]|uniref:hypothetical protein n=1 Tax=uncultured Rossellomorea sp. TaxID=2837549 RepID=UPI002635D2E4|nr:hypothetical protein [uncultured Rossellomorea sp.]
MFKQFYKIIGDYALKWMHLIYLEDIVYIRGKEGSTVLKILRKTISIIVLALSLYGLASNHNDLLPYTMAGLAVLMVIMGAEEHQKDRKSYRSYLFFAVSAFLLMVFIQGFIYQLLP